MMKYRVTLIGYRERQPVIEALRDIYPYMSLLEVEHLVTSLPMRIEDDILAGTASSLERKLKSVGAIVEIEEYFLPFSEAESNYLTWVDTNAVEEAYRFTYLPTFNQPITIWVWQDVGDELHAFAQLGQDMHTQRVIKEAKWEIDEIKWLKLVDLIDARGFWDSDTWELRHGIDGAMWYFEGYRNKRYKVLRSWCPNEGSAYEVGMFFFREFFPANFEVTEIY